jgi:hypothetical protein
MPHNRQNHPNDVDESSSCVEKFNSDVQFFNAELPGLLNRLNTKHSDAVFTYINSYEIDSDDQTNTGTNPLSLSLSVEDDFFVTPLIPILLFLASRFYIYP